MGSFKYFQKGNEVYAEVDNRMKIRWNKRFVPAAETITVLPSSVTLSKSSYTIKVEGSYTLSATVSPDNTTNKNVEWSSSNEEIATVTSGGKVEGVAVGECNIIAKCKADPSVKAQCVITVEAKGE